MGGNAGHTGILARQRPPGRGVPLSQHPQPETQDRFSAGDRLLSMNSTTTFEAPPTAQQAPPVDAPVVQLGAGVRQIVIGGRRAPG